MKAAKLTVGDYGDDVARLHEDLMRGGFNVPAEEAKRKFFGPATREAVSDYQRRHGLEVTGEVGATTAAALSAATPTSRRASIPGVSTEALGSSFTPRSPVAQPALGVPSASTGAETDPHHVEGRGDDSIYTVVGMVASPDRAGVGGLRVQIVDKNVGQDVPLAEGVTDERGRYSTCFVASSQRKPCKANLDLQARAFFGQTFLASSDVRYNATNQETLNILLPANCDALPSEHETLTRALATCYGGRLSDLKESDDRQDITYLANKTGWDARAVALAALADQFSQRAAKAEIPPSFFYALFRAGLPANEETLYHADVGTLAAIWKKAAEQGVIAKELTGTIPQMVDRFQALSAQKLLTGPALVGASSLKEMLTISRLDDAQQATFAQLYAANRADMPTFWKAAGDAFGQDMANRLQVDGKLGFLTINNAPLMQKVYTTAGANGLSDPLELAQMGYHRAEPWSQLLTADIPIPKEIPGDTPETRWANYANYLAAQVRLSYPTAAVAQMVKSGELPLTGAANGVPDNAHAFLTEHQGKFEIGVQPVQQYIAQNNLQVADETVQQVKRLQRVYQITPSDQALTGLMKRGIDAAYHVVSYDKDTFVQSFAADLGGADHAALTYDKSVQVHNTVLNIALSYLNARTAPAIGVHSPPSVLDPAPANAGDVIAYATLESLFGSMDFCACDHCRSILSPAAYLVDLLLFLKSDPEVWADFRKTWKQKHANAPYPFVDQNAWQKFQSDWNSQHPGQPLPNTEISPFDVLMSRRPDIEQLPLTCENTNTALPYIDVVNETLEYFIANNSQKLSLKDYQGYDTSDAASEDLLASPQYVMDSAYTALRNERFPAPLPFHQPLESLRRYFNKFEVPLPMAMERLRKSDDLERGANPYGWRDILMEEIGLSRAEYEILTDSNAVPLWRMYGFPNGTADADVIAGLSNAKQFARRVGISYDDIVAILKTRFVNPNSDLIPKLERLEVAFATLDALHKTPQGITDDDFNNKLPTGAGAIDVTEFGGNKTAWEKDNHNYAPIIRGWLNANDNFAKVMGLITLTDPTGSPDSCSFDKLEFCYAKPMTGVGDTSTRLGAVEFVRLLRFIRLWKKTGWTIEQTDAAICALYRADMSPLKADDMDTVTKLDTGFLTLLPRLGIVVRVMHMLNLTPKRDLLLLLTCWSEIGTHGDGALYRQMFLNPALLKQDAVFADNGFGEFLHDNAEKLLAHAEALRSAFNLTDDEFDLIINALGFNTVVDVPYIHLQPSLEKSILDAGPGIGYDNQRKRLSYTGFLSATTHDALKSVAGVTADFQAAVDALYLANQAALRPLTLIDISAIYRRGWLARKLRLSVRELLLLASLTGFDPFVAPDLTNPAILQLVSLVQALKDRSLKSAVALYLIWNQDLSGKSAPDPAQITELARTLRGDYASIEDQFAVTEDPGGDIARARMTLVYGQETSDAFFALLDDKLMLDVAYTHPRPTLEAAIITADGKIVYDDFRHRLSHTGFLNTATRDALKQVTSVTAAFQNAVDTLFSRGEDAKGSFFTRYPELKPLYDAYIVSLDPLATKRRTLLASFRPELSRQRKRQQALQRLSATAATDLAFTQALLDPPVPSGTPYPLHAAGHNDQPALNDVLALETPGLAAQFFYRDTVTGAVDLSVPTNANLDYSTSGANPLPKNPTPGNAISSIWRGLLETPEAGFYNVVIEADVGANVTLSLGGQARALTQNGKVWRNSDPLELKAGTLYEIVLTVEKVRDALSVKWETPKRPREVVPARYLYPPTILSPFSDAYTRFLKAASLVTGLGLTANEMAYFATHTDYRINAQGQIDSNGQGWLNALPNADNLHLTNPAHAAIARNLNAALLTPLRALLDFARIKADISPSDESLLTALKDPTTATRNSDSLLFTITRWNQTSLNDVLAHFSSNIAGLGHFDLFRRVYDAFALIQKMGISAKALIQATTKIQATTNNPTSNTVRDLQAALRARYDAADWRDVVRPINDEMRSLQRDALVAYILHRMRSNPASAHIDTADKLFEYFLMDVQMDPCMQTSRIRHALSSVQLFIERCLMNLEPRVSPAAINAKQWEWMKRYRVWEANRKVYLFPENWLEPELRDDQSPFFKETMSELLQSDITEDTAATALLNYLSKLEEVTKLEPCGIYYVEPDPGKANDIVHVVARTAGAHRKYYYRRREGGSWTPWEQIKLDIEDNPVIPVVWRGRLLLFWLRILKQVPLALPTTPTTPPPKTPGGPEPKLTDLTLSEVKTDAKNNTDQNVKVTVQAVLCWSEYYNGKWQPAKTSDVNHPTTLEQVKPDPKAFNRSNLRLSVFEERDALRVSIDREGSSSFLLYNTHSLPLREEDSPYNHHSFHYGESRSLNTSGKQFTINYSQRIPDILPPLCLPRPILTNQIDNNAVGPQHRLQNAWDAPFFFEDSRHVFYVTTTEQQVPIPDYPDYGVTFNPSFKQVVKIPLLILQTDPRFQVGPKFWGDGGPVGPDTGVIDPTRMQRFITEDAYIRQGIGTTAVVGYGDRQIGPSGAIMNVQAGR